uniref:Uncharacterized protein n=1 Tax=Arundo donax TaxID=35708 RepID=A0A0A9B7J0_ARUDO
MSLDFSSSG